MGLRLEAGERLVIASHNRGKLREIAELLAPYRIDVVSAGDLGLSERAETEATFAGNARLKAVAAAEASGLKALSDDSGLEVEALDGAPGIRSARWAGPAKDFVAAMRRVEDELAASGSLSRRANFTCALCLAAPGGAADVYEGKVFGALVWPPRGTRGFGYDPMFLPDGATLTFGEMEPGAKHAISHRAIAFRRLVEAAILG